MTRTEYVQGYGDYSLAKSKQHESKSKKPKSASCHGETHHPDHSYALPRLRRVEGQLRGLEGMIAEKRYCVDILIQFRAAMAALRNLEVRIFETHLQHCLKQALETQDPKAAEEKIREISKLLERRTSM